VSAHRRLSSTALALSLAAVAASGLVVSPTARADVQLSVEEGVLRVLATGSDLNVVDVRYNGFAYVVRNQSSDTTTGAGCILFVPTVTVCGGEIGSAVVIGAEGPDVIDFSGVPIPVDAKGGPGDDGLSGGRMRDTLAGDDGVDQVTGSAGDDALEGGADDDLLVGRDGKDVEFGGSGDDILQGGAGDGDALFGNSGADLLEGGPGADTLAGASGADVLAGGTGRDDLTPGAGDDAVLSRRSGQDMLNCPRTLDGTGTDLPCADLQSGAAPEVWPPLTGTGATTSLPSIISRSRVKPFVPGNATYVKLRIRDTVSRLVTACIRTRARSGRRLRPYSARTRTRFWLKVGQPPPPRRATTGTVRRGRCQG
jgi:RTX calcium-binding nonapeptide repeat (4 copies)